MHSGCHVAKYLLLSAEFRYKKTAGSAGAVTWLGGGNREYIPERGGSAALGEGEAKPGVAGAGDASGAAAARGSDDTSTK